MDREVKCAVLIIMTYMSGFILGLFVGTFTQI